MLQLFLSNFKPARFHNVGDNSLIQAMAMLRKALVASFIATPSNNRNGNVEMKSTENRFGKAGWGTNLALIL